MIITHHFSLYKEAERHAPQISRIQWNQSQIQASVLFLDASHLAYVIISVTIYNQSYHTITDNINTSVQTNLNMVETVILKKIDEMDGVANSIYMNPDMIDRLSYERPTDRIGFVNELAELNKIIDSYDLPNRPRTPFVPILYMLNRSEFKQYNFSRNVTSITEIEKEKWYTQIPPKAQYSISGPHVTSSVNGKAYSLRLTKRLFGLKNISIPFAECLRSTPTSAILQAFSSAQAFR